MAERTLIDYHIHSDISADCEFPMKDMAAAARRAGLNEICFTEHVDIDFPGIDFSVDFERYNKAFVDTQAAFPDIRIRKGLEAGLDPAAKERTSAIIESIDADYVIGSVHTVFGADPFIEAYWDKSDVKRGFEKYLNACAQSAAECDNFDVFGHLGFVSKGCPYDNKQMYYSDYADIIDVILKALIDKGKGLEANTSGLVMTSSTLPETPVLKRFLELGGEIVTVGSDAHRPEAVGRFIPETMDTLKSIGFKYVCSFVSRKPVFNRL